MPALKSVVRGTTDLSQNQVSFETWCTWKKKQSSERQARVRTANVTLISCAWYVSKGLYKANLAFMRWQKDTERCWKRSPFGFQVFGSPHLRGSVWVMRSGGGEFEETTVWVSNSTVSKRHEFLRHKEGNVDMFNKPCLDGCWSLFCPQPFILPSKNTQAEEVVADLSFLFWSVLVFVWQLEVRRLRKPVLQS